MDEDLFIIQHREKYRYMFMYTNLTTPDTNMGNNYQKIRADLDFS